MLKKNNLMTLNPKLLPSHSLFNGFLMKPKKAFVFALFSFYSSLNKIYIHPNPVLFHYLIKTLKFSETQALTISTRFSHVNSIEKPQSVIHFLQTLGFSNSHIRSAVHLAPQLLFTSDINKFIVPKIKLFQDLGLVGHDLGKFISKNSTLLTASLENRLVPRIEILKKILLNNDNNKDLIKVLNRCNWIISKYPNSRLLSNIAFLESCGIVGSQLEMLLRRQPRLFVMKESKLKDLVSRVLTMGFSVDSRMLVYGLYTLSCLSDETLDRKFGIFRSYGFLEYECIEMFKRAPNLLKSSEEKLKLGIDFFLNTIKIKKEVLVRVPSWLMFSIQERVLPRYKVLEIIKSKKLLKKEPSFLNVLHMTEEEFMQKLIARFPDEAEELLVAYKGHALYSSSEEEKS